MILSARFTCRIWLNGQCEDKALAYVLEYKGDNGRPPVLVSTQADRVGFRARFEGRLDRDDRVRDRGYRRNLSPNAFFRSLAAVASNSLGLRLVSILYCIRDCKERTLMVTLRPLFARSS